ncbi:MAG: carbon-nitrogen hydrolase family protein [Proteobacteria bacterium]|nr:MAG: carbon-nitrogen hydrolase family protein [Pseudomonadota bacterium]
MNASTGDNLDAMGREIARVVKRFPWVRMIVFGELCAHGPDPARAQSLPGPAEKHFCGLARKHRVWLVPGSFYEIKGSRVFNTAPVIDPDGEVVARHRKIYPWKPYEKGIDGGLEHTVFDVEGVGRFGLSICYDMWFPETTRALVCQGAEVIIHPTMTNTIDRDVELAIARANAVTNQCYFIDVNNTGRFGLGRSVFVGPEGEIIHESGSGEEVVPVVVDLERVRRTREKGVLGLGQPLKSFRDEKIGFPQYGKHPGAYLRRLGVLD